MGCTPRDGSDHVSRRTVLKATGAGGIGLTSLAGCTSLGGSRQQELVVSTYGGSFQEFMRAEVADVFEEQADGDVSVELVPYATLAKLRGMKDDPTIDVVLLDDFDVIGGGTELFGQLDSEVVTRLDNQYQSAYLPGGYGVSHIFGSYGLAFNTEQWSASDLESWTSLWDSAFGGELGIQNNWPHFMVMAARALGGNVRNMQPLWDKLPALSENVEVFYESFAAPEQLFTQGQISVASWFDGRTYAMRDRGASLDYRVPAEGAVQVRGAVAVMKNSRVTELGQQFIDLMLAPDVQVKMAEQLYYGPTNTAVELGSDIAEKVVYQDDLDQLIVPDWKYINEHRESWTQRWQENI